MSDVLNIYVIMHKPFSIEKYKLDKCYKRLLVGQEVCEEKDIILDSTGDNISSKNKNYCELTGLYWIWKNTKDNYIGLCHYRRLFTNNRLSIIKEKEVRKILTKYDIILSRAEKIKNNSTVYKQYEKSHYISDIVKCKKIIKTIFPEYVEDFEQVFNGNKYYPFNMFIAKKSIIDDYCKWLFEIFNQLEKEIDIQDRNDYQKRVYGFISERLFYVWIKHNNLKIHENVVLKTDDKIVNRFKFVIKSIIMNLNNLCKKIVDN